jgi:hypothetical protein
MSFCRISLHPYIRLLLRLLPLFLWDWLVGFRPVFRTQDAPEGLGFSNHGPYLVCHYRVIA